MFRLKILLLLYETDEFFLILILQKKINLAKVNQDPSAMSAKLKLRKWLKTSYPLLNIRLILLK